MFIGQIGLVNNSARMTMLRLNNNQSQIIRRLQTSAVQQKRDTVTINSGFTKEQDKTGIYKPNVNKMKALNNITYTQLAPDERLKAEILPASERSSYTENDALMNEYMKQYRIEGRFEGDTFVRDSDAPIKLILPDQVSTSDLESFRHKLNENELTSDIDWRGVKEDFWNMGVGFDNVERLEMKADYLTSRYAVLKDRIQNQFVGDKQISEMEKLESIYTLAKNEMASAFANSIGGFYEDLGQTGASADMKASILTMVDEKAARYEDYIAKTSAYAKSNTSDNRWLNSNDGYMAARLRESATELLSKAETRTDIQVPYSAEELSFVGVYAKTLSTQINDSNHVWDVEQDDRALGRFLAQQSKNIQKEMSNSKVGDKMSKLMNNAFGNFAIKFMDSLDQSIDKNKIMINKNPWMQGLIRTEHIDRDSVYRAYYNALAIL
ncbi:hypothetical protein RZO55_02155 [Clostridium boliviensis]|uniref:Flagellar hook-associated protein 2 C-terminal domain-containing protein n=1 Tax=Clostridium boliviensis TaxID=318465 RepID=A0ABU4GFH9_9CLOT|nr:hypothetical protein [Clostridium boliviensis]MDW2796390.1 hypothetical protein [Clostridium boliviensis]